MATKERESVNREERETEKDVQKKKKKTKEIKKEYSKSLGYVFPAPQSKMSEFGLNPSWPGPHLLSFLNSLLVSF